MTVTAAEPIKSTIEIDREFNRRYVSTFLVVSDRVDEAPATVVDAPGIPTYRTAYAWPPDAPIYTDSWAFAGAASADLLDPSDRLHWLVTVVHESLSRDNAYRPSITGPQDPTLEPERYQGTFQLFDKRTRLDRDDKVMRTYAGEPMPPYIVEDHRSILIVEKNDDAIDLDLRYNMIGTVNQTPYFSHPANVIKLAAWDFSVQYYGPANLPYVVNRFEFHFDFRKWQARRPNQGARYVKTAPPSSNSDFGVNVVDGFREPVPLNPDGTRRLMNADADITQFDILDQQEFRQLPISDTLPNPPFTPPSP